MIPADMDSAQMDAALRGRLRYGILETEHWMKIDVGTFTKIHGRLRCGSTA